MMPPSRVSADEESKSHGTFRIVLPLLTGAAIVLVGALAFWIQRAGSPLLILWNMTIALFLFGESARLYHALKRDAEIRQKDRVTIKRTRARADYLDAALQNSADIIFTVDDEGFIMKFNKGSEQHLGYTQEAVVGTPFVNLFVNEADGRRILNTVLLSGKAINAETPMKTIDGEIILLNLSLSEMTSDNAQIIGMVATAQNITEKKKLETELVRTNEQLNKLAITDSLTDLYNARHFAAQIKSELTRIKRSPDRRLSLMLMDVDHFKQYNDAEGHPAGDRALKSLGDVIRTCIRRDVDTGYRYGGDEFTVILPDTDKHRAFFAAQRILKQFAAFRFGMTSLSIGIVEAVPGENDAELIRRADDAMYRAKNDGGGTIAQ